MLNDALVLFVGGADEFVVLHAHLLPDILYLCGDAVDKLLGRNALFGGLELYLLAVLIRARHEEYIASLHAPEARDGVR